MYMYMYTYTYMYMYVCLYVYVYVDVYPKIHQDGLQNQPSWAPKSINLASKIHQVGIPNQKKSILGGLWKGLGAILAPRGTQEAPR